MALKCARLIVTTGVTPTKGKAPLCRPSHIVESHEDRMPPGGTQASPRTEREPAHMPASVAYKSSAPFAKKIQDETSMGYLPS